MRRASAFLLVLIRMRSMSILQTVLAKYGIKVKSSFQASLYDVGGHRIAYLDYATNPHIMERYSPGLPRVLATGAPCVCMFGSVQALCPALTNV